MGFPVLSIQEFENQVKERPKPWVVMLIVNAYSDSKAVKTVFDLFHIMDKISGDVDFYLPGYSYQDPSLKLNIANDLLKFIYEDYHIGNFFSEERHPSRDCPNFKIEKGPYVGKIRNGSKKIIFNEAEYADFVCEIISQKQDFEYTSGCQMLIIPIDEDTKSPEFGKCSVYDLDEITITNIFPLDRYIFTVFNILRKSSYENREEIIKELNDLYIKAVHAWNSNKYESLLSALIFDMERCLGWKLEDPYCFISYSSKDSREAFNLCHRLKSIGINTWIAPDGIPLGRDYSLAVPTALKRAKNFVILLSHTSALSHWVLRELDIAINNEDKIKVKVLFLPDYSINDIKENNQIEFYLNKVQIKFSYDEIINDSRACKRFIEE